MPYSRVLVLPFRELDPPDRRDSTGLSYTAPRDKDFHGKIIDAKTLCPRQRCYAKALMPPRELLLWHFEQCVIRCFREGFPTRNGVGEAELAREAAMQEHNAETKTPTPKNEKKGKGKGTKTEGKKASHVSRGEDCLGSSDNH
jgi:hypothetical protein